MTTPPPAGGPSGASAGGPRAVPPKPAHPPRASRPHRPHHEAYVPGDGMLAWLPFRPTIRIRLTLLYGGMFLMAGVVLLLLMYFFVQEALNYVAPPKFDFAVVDPNTGRISNTFSVGGVPMNSDQLNQLIAGRHETASSVAANTLLRKSLTVLVCLAVIAFAAGYAMAGRVLRPLGRITRAARDVASSDLHRRIELDGPDDELKELADTFDDMLDRLDRSFDSQRRFVANASHELRTPLAINRTLLEVQLSDPAASADLQQLGKTLLATNERSEQLVEGLLLLARSENELTDRRAVELSEVATRALEQTRGEADKREVELRSKLDPAVVAGNGVLLERLALNLLQNAVRYNTPGGWVELATATVPGGGELVVSNTGPVVPGYELEHIFEPFRRVKGADRTRSDKGVGLGLSIVRSVVRAHGGTVEATPRAGGGLTMRVRIPAP